MLKGLSILLVFQCIGEIINRYWQIPISGPIIGMLLLFAALQFYRQPLVDLEKCSTQLIHHLPLLFLPAGVGIYFLGSQYSNQWLAIFVAITVGTVLTMLITALVMKFTMRLNVRSHHDG